MSPLKNFLIVYLNKQPSIYFGVFKKSLNICGFKCTSSIKSELGLIEL